MPASPSPFLPYCGRLAPSPTGYLHLGHARTFAVAAQRARTAGGRLRLRNDDLDRARCRPEFVEAMFADLQWLGLSWDGPVITQSERRAAYRHALTRLYHDDWLFPCHRSRRDVLEAAGAPHEGQDGDEPVYPLAFRPPRDQPLPPLDEHLTCNWRFRVPEGETLVFHDGRYGEQRATAGVDFGDFLVWRKDDVPSYQLACVVDDLEFGITEVVRGADLIKSTFRQLLLFRALQARSPAYYHCPLLTDTRGERLAKRHDALSLRQLRAQGRDPGELLASLIELPPEPSDLPDAAPSASSPTS